MVKKLASLFLPLLAAPAFAAQDITNEGLFVDALPMVLTASRMTQSPLDAPAPVTIIDQEMFRTSGFTEIHDLMRLVPGFLVADWPSGPPMVVNNGLGDANSRRLQVLLDGRSIYSPFDGKVDWTNLPVRVDDIERIEVVRGPNPAVYGANSFQGVVNIITRSPHQEHGKSLSLTTGSGGTKEVALRTGNANGPLEWRLSLSRRESVNYRDLGVPKYEIGESIQRDVLNGQFAYQLNPNDDLRFQIGMTRSNDTSGAITDTENPPHSRIGQSNFFQAAWRHSTAPDEEISLQYYHLDSQAREPFLVDATRPINLDVNMQRDDLEFQQTLPLASNLRGLWGAGVRQDKVSSEHYLAGVGEVGGTQWQLFGNLAWQAAPRWLINAGGMVEKHYFTDTLLSPRVAANYSFLPNHVLRASTGRGYRTPTAFEERSREQYVYNGSVVETGYWGQHLQPEQVDFREIGYVGYFQNISLRVDARVFWNDYQNYIDDKTCRFIPLPDQYPCSSPAPANYTGSGKAFQFINSGNINVEGSEIQFDWRHPVVGRVVLGYAHTHIGAESSVDSDVPKSAPTDSTSLLWMRNFPGRFSASVGFYALTPMMWLNDGDKQPAYHRTDMRLAKQFGKRESGNEIALTLQNTGGNYAEFRSKEFVVERRSFITLRLGW